MFQHLKHGKTHTKKGNTMFVIKYISSIFLMISTLMFSSHALSSPSCEAALIQDNSRLYLNTAEGLAMSQLLYESMNRDASWRSSINVPIDGIPLSGEANSVNRYRSDYFKSSNLEWSQQRLSSVATQTLSENAVRAYTACVKGQHKTGTRIYTHDATDTTVSITVEWFSAVGAKSRTKSVQIVAAGGAIKGTVPSEWTNAMSQSFIIDRQKSSDLTIIANIGGSSDTAFVSKMPPPPTHQSVLEIAYCVGKGGQAGVHLWGPKGTDCNLLSNGDWGQYISDPRIVTSIGSCKGRGGFDGVTLWGPVGEDCGGNPNWGLYTNPKSVAVNGISSCVGKGKILSGHSLFGPTNALCGGFKEWGPYNHTQVVTNKRVKL